MKEVFLDFAAINAFLNLINFFIVFRYSNNQFDGLLFLESFDEFFCQFTVAASDHHDK